MPNTGMATGPTNFSSDHLICASRTDKELSMVVYLGCYLLVWRCFSPLALPFLWTQSCPSFLLALAAQLCLGGQTQRPTSAARAVFPPSSEAPFGSLPYQQTSFALLIGSPRLLKVLALCYSLLTLCSQS